jgi:hypothetical protein
LELVLFYCMGWDVIASQSTVLEELDTVIIERSIQHS